MSAIEYGSYYWCVILNGKDANTSGEIVHLHADEMAIEANGGLTFKSAGRRPAGSDPKHQKEKQDGKDSGKDSEKDSKESGKESGKDDQKKDAGMIYVAFGAGTWRVVYAAKLQDGSPAAIEHWAAARNEELAAQVPPNSGAAGYVPPHE